METNQVGRRASLRIDPTGPEGNGDCAAARGFADGLTGPDPVAWFEEWLGRLADCETEWHGDRLGQTRETTIAGYASTCGTRGVSLWAFKAATAALRVLVRNEAILSPGWVRESREQLIAAAARRVDALPPTIRGIVGELETASSIRIHASSRAAETQPPDAAYRTVSRLIEREAGASLTELRQLAVMRRAANLLANTDERTAQIAYALGYEHPSPFDRRFVRQCGVAPRCYRRLVEAMERSVVR